MDFPVAAQPPHPLGIPSSSQSSLRLRRLPAGLQPGLPAKPSSSRMIPPFESRSSLRGSFRGALRRLAACSRRRPRCNRPSEALLLQARSEPLMARRLQATCSPYCRSTPRRERTLSLSPHALPFNGKGLLHMCGKAHMCSPIKATCSGFTFNLTASTNLRAIRRLRG